MNMKRLHSLTVAILVAVFLATACSSGGNGNSDDGPSTPMDPMTPDLTSPLPSVANGYSLSSETLTLANDVVAYKEIFILNNDENTILRYRENENQTINFDVVYTYNDEGLITKKQNLDADGAESQRFESSYDDQKRRTGVQSYNDDVAFLTSSFVFNASGLVSREEVVSSANGSVFSETTYIYDSNDVLSRTILTSPAFGITLTNDYEFTPDGKELVAVVAEDNKRTSYEYDANGNVASISRFDGDGTFLSRTNYEYTETTITAPNIPLYSIVYEPKQL